VRRAPPLERKTIYEAQRFNRKAVHGDSKSGVSSLRNAFEILDDAADRRSRHVRLKQRAEQTAEPPQRPSRHRSDAKDPLNRR